MYLMILGQAAAALQALQSRKSGQRIFFEAASHGEQGVASGLRPAASRPLESAANDLLAGAFHDAGAALSPAGP